MAINDVKWVLSELTVKLSTVSMNTGKKHFLKKTTQKELISKSVYDFCFILL
jgi:hypothetical protein